MLMFYTALLLFLCLFPNTYTIAQESSLPSSPKIEQRFFPATVTKVIPAEGPNASSDTIEVTAELQSAERKGESIVTYWSDNPASSRNFKIQEGSSILLMCTKINDTDESCDIISQQRGRPLLALGILFIATIWLVSRMRGVKALAGLAIGMVVILKIIIPLIVNGWSPVLISLIGGFLIILPAIYLSHGFNSKSHIALIAIFCVGIIITLLSLWFSQSLQLIGMGNEEALYLNPSINLHSVLISAIFLGALGVIDDLAMTQVSIVNELYHSNRSLSALSLYKRAMQVGHDHIASVINTLFLAYVGVSLPLLLLIQQNQIPAFVAIQQEPVATEIMRTIIGTIGLLLVVPLATYITAVWVRRYPEKFPPEAHHHSH